MPRGHFFDQIDVLADVYTLKWILHDWNDDACRDILARVKDAMPSGSRLVAIDIHREPGRPNFSIDDRPRPPRHMGGT